MQNLLKKGGSNDPTFTWISTTRSVTSASSGSLDASKHYLVISQYTQVANYGSAKFYYWDGSTLNLFKDYKNTTAAKTVTATVTDSTVVFKQNSSESWGCLHVIQVD